MKNNSRLTHTGAKIQGWWNFQIQSPFADSSAHSNPLLPTGEQTHNTTEDSIAFDGAQWLSTANPILDTEQSYSVATWVRLDSQAMGNDLQLKHNEYALTAVSQDASTHSAFYLGVRKIENVNSSGEVTSSALHWNFTVAPIDGSETGAIEWQHAYAKTPLDNTVLDKWVLLVGVCDTYSKTAGIYVPSCNQSNLIIMPDELVFLQSTQGLQIGKGRWLGRNVDYWPGSIKEVKAFSGILTESNIQALYQGKDFE